ncbi:MAG: CapA family protein [Clostridia bacterium]|nr:CapA family protein [Clostridia bacterium]
MKRSNIGLKIVAIIFLVTVTLITINIVQLNNNQTEKTENIVANNLINNDTIVVEIEEEPKVYKATLVGTGDALVHSPIYRAAYNSSEGSYDFTYMMEDVKDIISKYDIKYYNQEVIFDDDKPYSTYPIFNIPSDWGENMINDMGFNLVSLATNHSMDCGNASAKKNAEWWESKTNILATGMASSEERRNEHRIFEANGITYTMLSYTYGTNGIPVQEDYVVNLFDEETVLEDIKAVRDKVDVLIVAMHWGIEYNTGITEEQKEQAKFLGENGVDIILGNHSHCIEPWEWIDEDTVVFYSFGNFISNQMAAEEARVRKVGPVGMLGTLEITKTVDPKNNTSKIKIGNIGAELIYTYRYYNSSKGKNDYKIIPFSKLDDSYLKNYEEVYEEFSEILKKFDQSIQIVPLSE